MPNKKATGRPRKPTEVRTDKSDTALTVNQKAATEVVKQKRKRPDLSELQTPHCEPGEISEMIRNAMTISHWPEIDTNDADQVAERIDQYHAFCVQHDMKPDMSGLAMALGVTTKTVWAWENGVDSNKPQAVRNTLKKGRQMNEILLSQMMLNGKVNPVTGIFLLKNNHAYRDQQDVVITPNNPMEQLDAETARKRLMESMPSANIEE